MTGDSSPRFDRAGMEALLQKPEVARVLGEMATDPHTTMTEGLRQRLQEVAQNANEDQGESND